MLVVEHLSVAATRSCAGGVLRRECSLRDHSFRHLLRSQAGSSGHAGRRVGHSYPPTGGDLGGETIVPTRRCAGVKHADGANIQQTDRQTDTEITVTVNIQPVASRAATHTSPVLYSTTTYSHSHAVRTAFNSPGPAARQLMNHQYHCKREYTSDVSAPSSSL